MTSKVLFIGLDGATFTVLDPLMERGVMPNLKKLIQRGTRGTLRSIIPPLTPPAWTSMMTGKRPGQHGVFDFFQKEARESEYFQFSNSQSVHSATIWSIASDADKRVISLNFPLMFPPPEVNGCVVPGGWIPWKQLRLGCFPPGLFDRLKRLPSFNAQELAFDMTLEAKAIEGCEEEEYADWIKLHERREARWLDILEYLMSSDPGDLVGIMFDGVDKLQHLCWRFLDPDYIPTNPTAWEAQIIELCDDYFRGLDRTIQRIVELAGPEATVVLGSDHGFGPTEDIFFINSWLESQGYLSWSEDWGGPAEDRPMVGFGQMTRHVYQMDWSKTRAYAATPSSQGIHIVSRRPDGSDIDDDEYRETRNDLIRRLMDLRNPRTGQPVVSRTWTKEQAFPGPLSDIAPDITLTLANKGAISILRSESIFVQSPIPKGNHRWDGMFVATGPLVRERNTVDELSLIDLAPLLLYSLGTPIPDDIEGRVPVEILKEGVIDERPAKYVAAGSNVQTVASLDAEFDKESEEIILQRLRALGYVE
jgi:predicted AlkP superfamily phosphohydrolase/phosphomutase